MKFDVYTMGFSNRDWDETLEILAAYKIKRLIDIRTLPGSKHTPQFNLEHLQQALPTLGIGLCAIHNSILPKEATA